MRACYVHFSMSFRIELSCMSLYPLLLRHGSLMFSLFRLPVSFLNSDFSFLFFDLCFSNPGFFRFRFSVFQFCSYFSVFKFLFLFFRFLIFCFSDFRFPACMYFPRSGLDRKESRNCRRNDIVKHGGFSHKSRKPTDYRYKKEAVNRLSTVFSRFSCRNMP